MDLKLIRRISLLHMRIYVVEKAKQCIFPCMNCENILAQVYRPSIKSILTCYSFYENY